MARLGLEGHVSAGQQGGEGLSRGFWGPSALSAAPLARGSAPHDVRRQRMGDPPLRTAHRATWLSQAWRRVHKTAHRRHKSALRGLRVPWGRRDSGRSSGVRPALPPCHHPLAWMHPSPRCAEHDAPSMRHLTSAWQNSAVRGGPPQIILEAQAAQCTLPSSTDHPYTINTSFQATPGSPQQAMAQARGGWPPWALLLCMALVARSRCRSALSEDVPFSPPYNRKGRATALQGECRDMQTASQHERRIDEGQGWRAG